MNNRKDIIKLHTAVALFGLAGVIGKFVTWPAAAITFGRVFFSSLFLLLLMLIKREKIKLDSKNDYIVIIIAGIIMAIHWTSFIHSIQVSSVAIGTITFASFPLFVTFLEPLIFREKLKISDIIVALVMLGGVVITVPELSLTNSVTVGVIWGLVGSFTYAVLSLMNRYFSGRYPGRLVCLYEQGTAAIILIPVVIGMSFDIKVTELAAIAYMGIFCTAIAHSIFVSALNKVKVQTAGIISGMETVYSILFAVILLHDMITVREAVGGIIILTAAGYKSIKK